MRNRAWIVASLLLGLLVPAASADQKKPHAAGPHPKPNHPMSKVKSKKYKPPKTQKHKH